MFKFLYPHYRFNSIVEISHEWLEEQELFNLLLDVDSTLKYYRSKTVLPEVVAWIKEMGKRKIRFCLVSNGRQKRIAEIAKQLKMDFIAPAYKPFPSGCRKALQMKHFDPQYTCLIGDQLFTDVMAANLTGIRSVLVKPLRPFEEPIFAQIKRPLEWLVLKFDRTDKIYSSD